LKVLSCSVSPQHVETGNPNCGLSKPSGMGAGVKCNLASFSASGSPDPCFGDLEDPERSKKSVARKEPLPSESLPFA
jgi:hypothetical protein